MRLIEQIQALGCRLRIIQVVKAPKKTAARKVKTRVVKLDELAAEVRAPVSMAGECCSAFEPARIFAKAGVTAPAHGWTVERLAAQMAAAPYKGLGRAALQAKVLETLAKDAAKAEDVVADAIARDRALDAAEDQGRKLLAAAAAARSGRLAEIQAALDDLNREVHRLDADRRIEDERFAEWRRSKRSYEKTMAGVLSVLVEDARISVSDEA
jgi:hypothetical protein